MRILVIEDEAKIANFIHRGLKEDGYAPDLAPDGRAGLEMALSEDYDLIVLDLMLPEIGGLEVCRRIRSSGNAVPIIMLTAKDTLDDKVTGLDSGADDYLTKPFAFEEFLARVRALLRKSHQIGQTKLKVADLVLDLKTHKVHRAGQDIDLSAKEYSLLEYLMYNSGKVLSRTMISQHVWDINYDTFTNVIDVHINRLRKKLDQDFEPKLIQTVRGCGYILKAE